MFFPNNPSLRNIWRKDSLLNLNEVNYLSDYEV